jgi:chromate transporter
MSNVNKNELTSPARIIEVCVTFLKLGVSSFGGPIAHLGYFHHECIIKRKWMSEKAYADLVAMCQFLPGPASSQVAFILGLVRAGPFGAAAAWCAFTLPSAFILMLIASGIDLITTETSQAIVHGLKLAAIGIVAQALWMMARQFCSAYQKALTAISVFIGLSLFPSTSGQVYAICIGACAGLIYTNKEQITKRDHMPHMISKRSGYMCIGLFIILLIFTYGTSEIDNLSPWLIIFNAFYKAGALVFGGGHVVLPLLETDIVQQGWMNKDLFYAGYGATQAMPGPLFTFAAYLGALINIGPQGMIGALYALIIIFIPGLLLALGVLPFWQSLNTHMALRRMTQGIQAAVVGILAYTFYTSLWQSTLKMPLDYALALTFSILLIYWRIAPWIIVSLSLIICIINP